MTEVINVRFSGRPAGMVDIGRGGGLLGQGGWGNPFTHRREIAARAGLEMCATRDEAIARYRRLLWALLAQEIAVENRDLLDRLAGLDGKVLGCWCKPLACHGDVLVRASAWATTVLQSI